MGYHHFLLPATFATVTAFATALATLAALAALAALEVATAARLLGLALASLQEAGTTLVGFSSLAPL